MDLDLSPEQEMLREMARGVCSSYSPLEGLKFGYNAAYTASDYTEVNPAAPFQLTGYQLKNVPKWDMSITAAYDWALTNVWHAHVGGDFRSVGKEWDEYVQSRSLGGYPSAVLPSYTVLDLNAAVARGSLTVKFFARNLAAGAAPCVVQGVVGIEATHGSSRRRGLAHHDFRRTDGATC